MVTFDRIQQRTMRQSIAADIRDAILDGELEAGTQLREAHIARDMGTSRAPVREALASLQDEGLVVSIPYRGTYVSQVSARTIEEIRSIRMHLEPMAIERSMDSPDGGPVAALREALQRMQRAVADDDGKASISAHLEFHRSFYAEADHDLLLDVWDSFEGKLSLFFAVNHLWFPSPELLIDQHRVILQTVEEGDTSRLLDQVATHLAGPDIAEGDGA